MQVPLAGGAVGLGDAGPGGSAEDGLPVVGRQLSGCAPAVTEQVDLALRAAGLRGEGRLEPGVVAGGVVGDDVDDDPESQIVGCGEHRVEVGQRSEDRVDVAVIGNVVAGVALRRRLERGEPDGVDTEVAKRGKATGDAGQIAEAVAVGVRERARIDLVDDGGTPPFTALRGRDGRWGLACHLGGFGDGEFGDGGFGNNDGRVQRGSSVVRWAQRWARVGR